MSILGNDSSAGKKPTTPVIGTATDGGTGTTVSVPFTPSTYIGKGTITYTALSNPGSFSATSSGTPITVSGLTAGTAYTFTVTGNTNYGVASDASSASNSITPQIPNNFEHITTVLGTSGTAQYTISNIPQSYKSLQLRIYNVNYGGAIVIRPNSQSSGIYEFNYAVSVGNGTSTNFTSNGDINTGGWLNGGSPRFTIDFPRYTGTYRSTFISSMAGVAYVSGQGDRINAFGGIWDNTTAITSLDIRVTSNVWYGDMSLYGLQ